MIRNSIEHKQEETDQVELGNQVIFQVI